ncbi:hypothetical protein [Oryza sativa Japonica Group]|uniref:Uncharacterized protein n=1 Tax=Oryza sativa subsp. japonica TaxID=39947 RepID=Q5JJU7_ORYSJ|nr:hypothetical protein [Oryza sativa Japonica Group]
MPKLALAMISAAFQTTPFSMSMQLYPDTTMSLHSPSIFDVVSGWGEAGASRRSRRRGRSRRPPPLPLSRFFPARRSARCAGSRACSAVGRTPTSARLRVRTNKMRR